MDTPIIRTRSSVQKLLPSVFAVCVVGALPWPLAAQAQCPSGWLPVPMTSDQVVSLAALPNGDVLVGGSFVTVGGVQASRIARYTPSTGAVNALGLGLDGAPSALAVFPNGDFVASGGFATAGGAPAFRIARYSFATGWSPMGTGVHPGLNSNNVQALALLPDGDVIAGGFFTSTFDPGGPALSHIARYTPSTNTWAPLGSGTGGTAVNALAVLPNGDIIAGGDLDSASGVTASRIARYTPSTNTWSAMGAGVDNNVAALAVLPGGDLIVGGFFRNAGGQSADFIARYAPATNTWSALGSGTDGPVTSLAVLPGGDVLVGGYFSLAGGVGANHIARYSPSTNTWSALGTGTNNTVFTVAADAAGNAYAGGNFNSAGGQVSRFGRFAWSPRCSLADVTALGGAGACPDGLITVDDLIAFLSGFFSNQPLGDVASIGGSPAPDGLFTPDDIIVYLAAFFRGCP